MTHRLSAASSGLTSSSPHSPVFSGQDWLSNKRRSHSFTSGFHLLTSMICDVPVNPEHLVCLGLLMFCLSCVSISATYQRIRPLLQPAGGLERGSNYCVTLVVGDKSSDGASPCRSSESSVPAAAEWQQDAGQDSALTSYASLPRPRNKSVFKKFFGKRDL